MSENQPVKTDTGSSPVSLTGWIERKLGLKVNATKTHITPPSRLKYLGFGFWKDKDGWKARSHEDSVEKFKRKLKHLCKRKWSVDLTYRIKKINEVTRGWINYFRIDHEFIVDKKCFIVYSKIVVNCVDLSKQVKSETRSIIICGEKMGYAFISYNSKDQDVSDSFKALLNRNGIKTWKAPEDIPPGLSYAAVITQAIKETSCFILLLSENAQNSIWMPKETERAVNYKKIIIPLQLDDAPMNNDFELMLSSIQAVTIRKIDDNDEKINQLIAEIKKYTDEKLSDEASTQLLASTKESTEAKVPVEQKQENIDSESKAYFEKNAVMHGSTLIEFKGRDSASVVIPEGVTDILDYAFSSYSELKDISIPSTVTKIGESAFDNCPNLQSISVSPENPIFRSENNCCIERETNTLVFGCSKSVIPEGVIVIGRYAFSHCKNLTKMEMPSNITRIEENAFFCCDNLTEIKFPASVTTIAEGAFALCNNLQSIQVSNQNPVFYSKYNCCIETKTHRLIFGCKNSIVPDGVISIANRAFFGCFKLNCMHIPRGVKCIGSYAFAECYNLTYIVLPDSISFIGHSAFAGTLQPSAKRRKIFCEFNRKPNGWDKNWTDKYSDVYWKDEWYYDENGNPVVKN